MNENELTDRIQGIIDGSVVTRDERTTKFLAEIGENLKEAFKILMEKAKADFKEIEPDDFLQMQSNKIIEKRENNYLATAVKIRQGKIKFSISEKLITKATSEIFYDLAYKQYQLIYGTLMIDKWSDCYYEEDTKFFQNAYSVGLKDVEIRTQVLVNRILSAFLDREIMVLNEEVQKLRQSKQKKISQKTKPFGFGFAG